jgi:hypothetical protein
MTKSILFSAILALGAMAYTSAQADTTVAVTPGATTFSGTVTEINPGSHTMILSGGSSSAPVTYTYSPDTVFLDEMGKTVSYEVIRSKPVRIEYTTEGDRKIVKRVVVTKVQ